jgi:hypothetical protein
MRRCFAAETGFEYFDINLKEEAYCSDNSACDKYTELMGI